MKPVSKKKKPQKKSAPKTKSSAKRFAKSLLVKNRTLVIVNPASAHGQTGKNWDFISKKLTSLIGDYSFVFTEKRGHATELAREFLSRGGQWIISVGGDGTLNEIVNAFFSPPFNPLSDNKKNMYPRAALSVIPTGTGSDFARTLGRHYQSMSMLDKEPPETSGRNKIKFKDISLDVGKVCCDSGIKYFINMASFSLGAEAVERMNRFKFVKTLGGKAGYYLVTVLSLLLHRNQSLHLEIQTAGKKKPTGQVKNARSTSPKSNSLHEISQNIAIANGNYQGGSMLMAPDANPADGLFEVILFGDLGILETIALSKKVYRGEHTHYHKIKTLKTPRIEITSDAATGQKIPLDLDGETFWADKQNPVVFEIIPAAIKIRI